MPMNPDFGSYQIGGVPSGWKPGANPYLDAVMRSMGLQPASTPQQPSRSQMMNSQAPGMYLSGRFIDREDDIVPGEVPMDGSVSFFPLRDGSGVVAKAWDSDGILRNFKFVLETTVVAEASPAAVEDDTPAKLEMALGPVLERLERIEQLVTTKEKPKSPIIIEE